MIRTFIALIPRAQRGRLVGYAVLMCASVAVRAGATVAAVPLVAALFSDTPRRALLWLGWLTVLTVAGWLIDFAGSRLGFDLGFAVLDHTQHDMADRLSSVRLDWFTPTNTATARQALAGTGPELVSLVVNLLTPLIGAILLPPAIGVALLAVSWQLGVAALSGVPLLLAAMWVSNRLSARADVAAGHANTALTERIIEFARTQQALRAARRVQPQRSAVGASLDAQHGAAMRLLRNQIPGQLVFSVVSQAALILLAGTATALTVTGALSVPTAIALIVVVVRYLEPFTALSQLAPALESTRATLAGIQAVLAAPQVRRGAAQLPDGTAAPCIVFDDVTFSYHPADPPVLDGVSFTLQAGTTTAVVGPSGSGKTTIVSLIAGLHEPTAGRVLFDGIDAAELDAPSRRAACSVVFQHPYLLDGTITENIRVGHADAAREAFEGAVNRARVDELITRYPDAPVGEGGAALSGGERQRVSIARALLKPAPVLLVDEATSALDTENEAAIVDALGDESRPRTRVIVAHRMASIARADRVLFLQAGRVVEDGTVEELLAAEGRFAQFWRQQHDAAGWRIHAG